MVSEDVNQKGDGGHFFALRTYRRACKKTPPTPFFICLLFIVILFHPGLAAAFTITPLRHTVVLDPGETKELPLFVVNDEDTPLTVVGEVGAFTIDADSGQAIFGATDVAKAWVTPLGGEITIEPGEHREVRFVAKVPQDAAPGSHYLALFAKRSAGSGIVGVGARAGALLFLHISGDVREELVRDDFSASATWLFVGPLKMFLQLGNSGTIHVVPSGEIKLVNARGKIISTTQLNSDNDVVYPDTRWRRAYPLHNLSWVDAGPLTIRMQLQYGVTKQAITDEVRVWYLPPVLLGTGVLLIGSLIFFAIRRARKI